MGWTRQRKSLAAALLILGAAVRLPGMFNDLWLDEIWSLNLARQAKNLADIFTNRIDNNHLLNTIYLYFVRQVNFWPVDRLMALAAGLGLLAVVWTRARRWPASWALITLILFCFSYPLIHYSSEARGYEPEALCAVVAFFAMADWLEGRAGDGPDGGDNIRAGDRDRSGRVPAGWMFVSVSVLGFLAHLTFVFVYGSLLIWSVFRFLRSRGGGPTGWELVVLHGPVLAFVAVLYGTFVRGMAIGGGPHTSRWAAVRDAAADVLNVSAPANVAVFAFALSATLVIWEIVESIRDRDDAWVFFVSLIAIPAAVIVVQDPVLLYKRYFTVCIPILLLMVGRLLNRFWDRGRRWRWRGVALAILGLFLAGGLARLVAFYEFGRGTYLQALTEIARQTPGRNVTITSNQDFQNYSLVHFYRDFVPGDQRLFYVTGRDAQLRPAEWLLYRVYPGTPAPPEEMVVNDAFYQRTATYRTGGEVGWDWVVYRKM